MRYLPLLILLLASCSSLVPSLPTMSSSEPVVASTKTTQVLQETTDTVWQWAWLSILLVFVFPSMRSPITAFLCAFFTVLRLPLDHVIMLYNQKFKNGKEEN